MKLTDEQVREIQAVKYLPAPDKFTDNVQTVITWLTQDLLEAREDLRTLHDRERNRNIRTMAGETMCLACPIDNMSYSEVRAAKIRYWPTDRPERHAPGCPAAPDWIDRKRG